MKFSKKVYRKIGTAIFLFAFIFLFGGILLTIADAYFNDGQHWFLGPLSIVGFFTLFVLAAVAQDKANHWYPLRVNVQQVGYMQNVKVQLAKQRYYVSFDLVTQEKQLVKSQVRLLTKDKILTDSFTEEYKISYSFVDEKKEEIWFPELHSKITIMS